MRKASGGSGGGGARGALAGLWWGFRHMRTRSMQILCRETAIGRQFTSGRSGLGAQAQPPFLGALAEAYML